MTGFLRAIGAALVGAAVGAATILWAQPELRADGFLTGWAVMSKRQVLCYNPYVSTKDRTITCG